MRRRLVAVGVVAAIVSALLVSQSSPADRSRHARAAAAVAVGDAVSAAVRTATSRDVTQYISVVDRESGIVLAETANAHQQVASESIMKLFIASYYLISNGGYTKTPAKLRSRLSYMLRYSDDATATALFRPTIIPTIAHRYGLTETANAKDDVGYWGAARITAHDMTRFLFRASRDPLVGSWLLSVMSHTAVTGSDGFNQHFGLNTLSGEHGSKQGWGGDSYWTAHRYAIHSVGYTDRYFVAILQTAGSYPDPARSTATATARAIQASIPGLPPDGTFVRLDGSNVVYRIVGGAPVYISDWAAVGGRQPVLTLDTASWGMLRDVPRDGVTIRAGAHGPAFRIAAGAPVPAAATRGAIVVDTAAIERAGGSGVWSHLRLSAEAAACRPFPDVNGLNVHCGNIRWLGAQGITKPADGLYHPRSAVTRGSMTAFLYRLLHPGRAQPECATAPFPDVPAGYRFCGYIAWAKDHHLAFGYSDGTFGPDNAVTRGAMAAFLYRIAGPGHKATPCTTKPFSDVDVDDTFCGVITWAKTTAVTYGTGDGTNYGTTRLVTRQAMASFLHRIAQ